MDDTKRRLLWHGAFLFLLGLVTGLAIPSFANPRMGLAAHLEGVMNGTFLLAVGAAWGEARLEGRARSLTFGLLLYGAYANWAVTSLAAVLATKAMTPLAGAGHGGEAWQEALVTAGFASVGVAIVAASVMLLRGFARHRAMSETIG